MGLLCDSWAGRALRARCVVRRELTGRQGSRRRTSPAVRHHRSLRDIYFLERVLQQSKQQPSGRRCTGVPSSGCSFEQTHAGLPLVRPANPRATGVSLLPSVPANPPASHITLLCSPAFRFAAMSSLLLRQYLCDPLYSLLEPYHHVSEPAVLLLSVPKVGLGLGFVIARLPCARVVQPHGPGHRPL